MILAPLVAMVLSATPAEQAAPAANAALDKAYAESQSKPDAVKSPHTGAWVLPEHATVSGNAKTGYTVRWTHFAPAGFEFEVEVSVSAKGVVKVLKASALYSPD